MPLLHSAPTKSGRQYSTAKLRRQNGTQEHLEARFHIKYRADAVAALPGSVPESGPAANHPLPPHDSLRAHVRFRDARECGAVTGMGRKLPLAMLVNECLFAHVTHSTADVPVSANFGQTRPLSSAPMAAVRTSSTDSPKRSCEGASVATVRRPPISTLGDVIYRHEREIRLGSIGG
jgi:hypothetical protein